MKKHFCVFLILSFLSGQIFAAGVLAHPRKINLLKTQHFDILYPDECSHVAAYVAEYGEDFFKQAQYYLETENNFRMPVVISPDSDTTSVTYSISPYRRLIIFEGVFSQEQLISEDTFGSMLYKEIYLAVAQSKMSPANQLIRDTVGGEEYSPISMFNLPVSLVEGYGYIIQSQSEYEKISDGYFLQLLAEAKLEGKFPSWFQTFAKRDIYPGDDLNKAAGTGFTAYLMQNYGIEKYKEFWDECGKLHPFFASGIIKKVYNKSINDLWKEFESQVPLPADLENIKLLDQEIKVYFENEESIYSNLVYSDFGIIWYDELRHEVNYIKSGLTEESAQNLPLQKKLFSAESVTKLSVSPDGRYLAVSFKQIKDGLEKNITWIYDLLDKTFLDDVFHIKDGSIIKLANGKNAVAGINVNSKIPKLQIYTSRNFGSQKNEMIFELEFDKNTVPCSPVYAGNGKFFYILKEYDSSTLVLFDIETENIKKYELKDLAETKLSIKNLVYQNVGVQNNDQELYSFQYADKKDNLLVKTGSFVFEDEEPAAVSLQEGDVSGGIHYSIFQSDELIFTSRKLYHDELRKVSLQKVSFQPGKIEAVNNEEIINETVVDNNFSLFDLSEYTISKYSLLTYWHRFSVMPFLPIKTIDFEEGPDSEPGIGLQVKLVPDPFMNNKLTISAAWSYLNLDFVWTVNTPKEEDKIINQNSQKKAKDKTLSFFLDNTSTPMDVKVGALFRCNQEGEYDFEILSGISWEIPLGFTFNKLDFDVYWTYLSSTDYYDVNLVDVYTSKKDFPALWNAYETINLSASVQFKNIHQFGSSSFRKKGFAAGFNIYSVWDVFKYRNQKETTDPYVTQVFLGLYGAIALPQVIPLKPNKDGWILTLPTTAYIKMAQEAGVFLDSNVETLLIGKEIQNGFSYINFYCNRFGLKFGMDYLLRYDTNNINLPDFRRFDYLYDIYTNSTVSNSYYLLLNLDFLLPIGPLSQQIICSSFKTTYYPDTKGFSFNLDFTVNF